MEKEFRILSGENSIGTATVARMGLYYHITCLIEATPCRILVTCGDRRADLGICVPMEGRFGIRTRVPVKRLGEGEFSFKAVGNGKESEEELIIVESDKPFDHISQLKNARLAVKNGKTGIMILKNHNSISSPTGQ